MYSIRAKRSQTRGPLAVVNRKSVVTRVRIRSATVLRSADSCLRSIQTWLYTTGRGPPRDELISRSVSWRRSLWSVGCGCARVRSKMSGTGKTAKSAKGQESKAIQLQPLVTRLVSPSSMKKQPLTAEEAKFLIESSKKAYRAARTALIDVEAPIQICGDTHGQYRDVVRIFDTFKWPPGQRYLFLGKCWLCT